MSGNEWTAYMCSRCGKAGGCDCACAAASAPAPAQAPAASLNEIPQFLRCKEEPMSPVSTVLTNEPVPVIDEAAAIIRGARQSSHGKAERSFDTIAGLWNAYLGSIADRSGATFTPITPDQVAVMMMLLKVGRAVAGDPKHRDHYVDIIGYAALAHELVSREAGS